MPPPVPILPHEYGIHPVAPVLIHLCSVKGWSFVLFHWFILFIFTSTWWHSCEIIQDGVWTSLCSVNEHLLRFSIWHKKCFSFWTLKLLLSPDISLVLIQDQYGTRSWMNQSKLSWYVFSHPTSWIGQSNSINYTVSKELVFFLS